MANLLISNTSEFMYAIASKEERTGKPSFKYQEKQELVEGNHKVVEENDEKCFKSFYLIQEKMVIISQKFKFVWLFT